MLSKRRITIFLLVIAMVLASCGGNNSGEATPDINAILTAGVGTIAASIFQTQTALVPQATETYTPTPIPTNTPLGLPSLTPVFTPTFVFFTAAVSTSSLSPTATGTQYTPTVNPSLLAVGCNNLRLVLDQNIPAGTVFKPGDSFTKTWKVENNGTCDWVYLYQLVFLSGNQMNGEPSKLGKVIVPGKWTQLSVSLVAPKTPGTYTGYWRFADQSGNMFGATLSVSIVVSAPTRTPQPTSTQPTSTPQSPTSTPVSTDTPTETPTPTPTIMPTST